MSTHDTTGTTIRVVILGGGYAGVIATNRFLGSLTDDPRAVASLIGRTAQTDTGRQET